MIVSHASLVEGTMYNSNGAKNALKKALIGEKEGWKDYVMRLFEVSENGHSPKHSHPWPHIVFIVKGEGLLEMEGQIHELKTGSYAFVPNDVEHQFRNTGEDTFSFICIVPPEGN